MMFTKNNKSISFALVVIALTLNACVSEKQEFEKGYKNKYDACINNPNPNPYSIKTEFDYDTAQCKCNNNEPCELGKVCGIYGQCEGIREKCDHNNCNYDSTQQISIVRLCDTQETNGDNSSAGNVIAKYNCPQNTICNNAGNGCVVPCADGEYRCIDNNHWQQCNSSRWGITQECTDDMVCNPKGNESNICITTCENNTSFCNTDTNQRYICNNNEWKEDGLCKDDICKEGSFTCKNGEVLICVNGNFISQDPKEQCNECISIDAPTIDGYNRLFVDNICKQCDSGSICNTSTNTLEECINGVYSPTDKVCSSTASDNQNPCNDQKNKCDNNKLIICDDGSKNAIDCKDGCCYNNKAYQCNNNTLILNKQNGCNKDETAYIYCKSDELQTINCPNKCDNSKANQYSETVPEKKEDVCSESEKPGLCNEGQKKCENNKDYQMGQLFTCNNNGEWEKPTPCATKVSCDKDGIQCGQCLNNTYKCNSNKTEIVLCKDGIWDLENSIPCECDPQTEPTSVIEEICISSELPTCEQDICIDNNGIGKVQNCLEGKLYPELNCNNAKDVSCKSATECGECLNGTYTCKEGNIYQCKNGTVDPDVVDSCEPKSCKSGAQTSEQKQMDEVKKELCAQAPEIPSSSCEEGEIMCRPGEFYECGSGGTWNEDQMPSYPLDKINYYCKPIEEGEWHCTKEQGDASSSDTLKEKCGECVKDSIKCNRGNFYKCNENGNWVSEKLYPKNVDEYKCNSYKNVEGNICDYGNGDNFTDTCGECILGNYKCNDGNMFVCKMQAYLPGWEKEPNPGCNCLPSGEKIGTLDEICQQDCTEDTKLLVNCFSENSYKICLKENGDYKWHERMCPIYGYYFCNKDVVPCYAKSSSANDITCINNSQFCVDCLGDADCSGKGKGYICLNNTCGCNPGAYICSSNDGTGTNASPEVQKCTNDKTWDSDDADGNSLILSYHIEENGNIIIKNECNNYPEGNNCDSFPKITIYDKNRLNAIMNMDSAYSGSIGFNQDYEYTITDNKFSCAVVKVLYNSDDLMSQQTDIRISINGKFLNFEKANGDKTCDSTSCVTLK